MTLHVDIEALKASATKVTAHGDDLAASHRSSAGQFSSARAGWKGRSAGALSNRAAQWATRSSDLVSRIDTQGQNMATSAERFREREEQNQQRLAGVYGGDGQPGQPPGGGDGGPGGAAQPGGIISRERMEELLGRTGAGSSDGSPATSIPTGTSPSPVSSGAASPASPSASSPSASGGGFNPGSLTGMLGGLGGVGGMLGGASGAPGSAGGSAGNNAGGASGAAGAARGDAAQAPATPPGGDTPDRADPDAPWPAGTADGPLGVTDPAQLGSHGGPTASPVSTTADAEATGRSTAGPGESAANG